MTDQIEIRKGEIVFDKSAHAVGVIWKLPPECSSNGGELWRGKFFGRTVGEGGTPLVVVNLMDSREEILNWIIELTNQNDTAWRKVNELFQ